MAKTIRAFIAIEINEEARLELLKLQDKLKQLGADVKWVKPQNLHLTLKFQGDTPGNKIQNIKDILKEIAGKTSVFSISLSKLGAFPNLNSPRIAWVGVKKNSEELKKIANMLGNQTFSSHVTLGRFRYCKKIAMPAFTGLDMTVSKITLFQSTLTPKGPVYKSLYEAMLKPI